MSFDSKRSLVFRYLNGEAQDEPFTNEAFVCCRPCGIALGSLESPALLRFGHCCFVSPGRPQDMISDLSKFLKDVFLCWVTTGRVEQGFSVTLKASYLIYTNFSGVYGERWNCDRNQSLDGHVWGFLPIENIIGDVLSSSPWCICGFTNAFLVGCCHWIIENKLFSSGIPKDGQRSNFGLHGTSVVSQPLRHEWHLWSSCSSWYFDILGGSRSLLAYLKRETVQTIVTIINVIAPRVCADFRSVETSWTVFFLLRPCGQHPKKRFPLTDIWSHHAHELLAAQKAPQWFSFGILRLLQTAGLTDWRDPSLLSVLRNLLLGQG